MVIFIEASNIRGGGGVTHLVELLKAAEPSEFGINKVYISSVKSTLDKIQDRPWLIKYHHEYLEKGLLFRFFWQFRFLKRVLKEFNSQLLFVPGGTYFGSCHPFVSISQNLLPFEWNEMKRYGFSFMTFKFLLLRFTQSFTFKNANGVIFLTEYARNSVLNVLRTNINSCIIPHGINKRFENRPRPQKSINEYSFKFPFRILYISSIDVYKHQCNVIKAIYILYQEGIPVFLDLVGPSEPAPLKMLQSVINKFDPVNNFVKYHGALPHESLHEKYIEADLGLFASSCETFGQIVTEAMSAGLPIACSELSSLPDVLGDAGLYFNPLNPKDISDKIRIYIKDPKLRANKADQGYARSKLYTWKKCATETFSFLSSVEKNN